MRWLVCFAVAIGGCVASIPDDPTLSADLAWGTATVLTNDKPQAQPPAPPAACLECDGTGVVAARHDEPEVTSGGVPADACLLVLEVPEAATVTINGLATTATGTVRRYMAGGMAAGLRYEFRVVVNGEARVVELGPGEQASLSFVASRQTCPSCGGCGYQTHSVLVTR